MRIITAFFLLLTTLTVSAAKTHVSGKIDGYFNEKIELLKNADALSKLKIPVGTDTISNDGSFQFEIELEQSFTGYLRVADRVIPFHLQPGSQIYLQLKCPEDLEDLLTPVTFDSVNVSGVEVDEWAQKDQFLQAVNTFIEKNQTRIFYKKADSVKAVFIDSILTEFNSSIDQSAYLKHFITFTLGGLEIVLNTPAKTVFDSLVADTEIMYKETAYTTFVTQFFNDRLNKLFNSSFRKIRQDLEKQPYETLSQVFANDEFLQNNEALREYVLLYFAFNDVKTSSVPTETWLKLMYKVAQNSPFEEHRRIAQNMIRKLDLLEQKELAPPFKLPNASGQKVELSEFQGKFVYLQFWADWSMVAVKDMKILERIHKENHRNIEIVSININRDAAAVEQLLSANKKFKWTFLHFNLNYQLLRDYAVQTAPVYVLLDQHGKVLMAPADSPVQMFNLLSTIKTNSDDAPAPYLMINNYEKERLR